VPHPSLAYISQGQLHLERDGSGEILESPFGLSLRDRAVQIQNRNAWKVRGRGGQSLSRALRMPTEPDLTEFRIAITSVARGCNPGELLYTLETDEISGVFVRDADGIEKRLFHTADFRACHLDAHPDGSEVAVSIQHAGTMANLAVLKTDGSGLTEITDGESLDQAPRWVPGPGRRLVFQSAGLARDSRLRVAGAGPFAVHLLDLDSNEMQCLAQDPKFDFLGPRIDSDGTLYYIRRPFHNGPQPVNPWAALYRTVLLPFRILWVTAMLIDFFVERGTGQPLFFAKSDGKKPPKTPSSWLLMRQKPTLDAETIAEGAQSFDLSGDGSVIYSNGVDIYRLPPDGGSAEKMLSGAGIDLIAAL
jgi:hypothetical protein